MTAARFSISQVVSRVGLAAAAVVSLSVSSAGAGPLGEMIAQATTENELALVLQRVESGTKAADRVRSAAERYEASLEKREADRAAKIAEVSAELDEHLSKVDDAGSLIDRAVALADAMRSAVEMQVLSTDGDAFMADVRISSLMRRAESTAREAEDASEWMLANELFARLNALLEEEDGFREDVNRLGQRLTMVRLYAPETLP
jgi:hypothetical protein